MRLFLPALGYQKNEYIFCNFSCLFNESQLAMPSNTQVIKIFTCHLSNCELICTSWNPFY